MYNSTYFKSFITCRFCSDVRGAPFFCDNCYAHFHYNCLVKNSTDKNKCPVCFNPLVLKTSF